ncbi:hypothetical protein GCM10009816_10660 [Microbacterium aquimaris]
MRDLGLGTLIYSPLAGGFLSGKHTREEDGTGRRTTFNYPPVDEEQGFEVLDVSARLAEEKDASIAQIALVWLLHKPGATSVILGARKDEQLVDNLRAADITLTDDDVAQLDAVSAVKPEYPGYLRTSARGETMFGRRNR